MTVHVLMILLLVGTTVWEWRCPEAHERFTNAYQFSNTPAEPSRGPAGPAFAAFLVYPVHRTLP